MADLYKGKVQVVMLLFLSEEFTFTIILEKILQTATKTDANAKSREFNK